MNRLQRGERDIKREKKNQLINETRGSDKARHAVSIGLTRLTVWEQPHPHSGLVFCCTWRQQILPTYFTPKEINQFPFFYERFSHWKDDLVGALHTSKCVEERFVILFKSWRVQQCQHTGAVHHVSMLFPQQAAALVALQLWTQIQEEKTCVSYL